MLNAPFTFPSFSSLSSLFPLHEHFFQCKCANTHILEVLLWIGLLLLSKWIFSFLYSFYTYFIRPGKNLRKYGDWAVVTGCTDGIGKAISEEFARKGLNLVLISRNQQKLDEMSKKIIESEKVKVKTFSVDFASPNAAFSSLKADLDTLDIGILVNNVGVSYEHAAFLPEITEERIDQLIRVNILGTIRMTQIVLPGMINRKRGAIINIGSASSMVTEPMYSVYAGTKAFIEVFSKSLHHECKEYGIHVQCQIPAFVATKLSKIRKTSFFVCSPRSYAKSFVAAIGHETTVISYWTHALQLKFASYLPEFILANQLLRHGKTIRKIALDKKMKAQ
jgi:17beta-estradiol 17-dehydrogenase / very-long-chain 3-oxoacyl-CoA reductase